jgi:hypothetical protein
VFQTYNHVGYLNSGVVDIVLHFNLMSQEAQAPDEGIAQRSIAQMTDMSGFVRIYVRVFDDDFACLIRFAGSPETSLFYTPGQLESESAAIEVEV